MKTKTPYHIVLFVFLLVTSCSPLPTPVLLSNTPVVNHSSTPVANFNNSMLEITGEKVFEESRLSAILKNQNYSVIPTQCWTVKDDPTYTSLMPLEAESAQIQFIIVSSKASVISEIELILDEYIAPPTNNLFSELYLDRGQHGGPVVTITLGDALLTSSSTRVDLANLNAYQLNEQDAIRFQVWTTFSQPGLYKFHLDRKSVV